MNYNDLKTTLNLSDEILNSYLEALGIETNWETYSGVIKSIELYKKLVEKKGDEFKAELTKRINGQENPDQEAILLEIEASYKTSKKKEKIQSTRLQQWLEGELNTKVDNRTIGKALDALNLSFKGSYTTDEGNQIRELIRSYQEVEQPSSSSSLSTPSPAKIDNSSVWELGEQISAHQSQNVVETLITRGEVITQAMGDYYEQLVLRKAGKLINDGYYEQIRAKVRASLPTPKSLADQIREACPPLQLEPSQLNPPNLPGSSVPTKQLKSASDSESETTDDEIDDQEDYLAEITVD